MLNQHHMGRFFLFLACLLVIISISQRVATHRLFALLSAPEISGTLQGSTTEYETPDDIATLSCELNPKSLSGTLPQLAEASLFFLLIF
ncbi:hypothetical protein BL250_04285 [Erwinia sp. OLTSP20]|uniref:hypothetical protein n=1 Tax=unclassified Erwinia TaxID=2622719 RepID=UPI000C1945B2|nr:MULTISPECIES: hypothetical protein [unclassified Erwinia]PIJ51712.1 hypothetical protein BV501_03215 [Erwinia sp. OAMSP11]PIJ75599.1 hypothetical protein BK416_01510 [Erwinia sp. OLSSP12]PIJ84904.1 hypothetical protein BLD47_01440 [Erwinia sp. OLCASP19]PIJ86683.1 hypothetical protein BLD46_03040 [Erwinia sp. OLMTSP26]PIJ88124.1 hypothetical protein BLD49_03720 [Erwinia sp. OLMDSP33]